MKSYIVKRIKSFGWAFKGLFDLFRNHPNAQIHLLAVLVVSGVGAFLGLSATEWCLVLLCMVLVIGMEAMNTALEYLTDLVSPDYHPLAGKAKDVAAAGVLICAIGAVGIAAIIFVPKLMELL
ncbi:MAG: diacylglycerol kinase family protein [Aureispira sp.]|nr:diacylglycerol kinase family protein [Aureispira sp.]